MMNIKILTALLLSVVLLSSCNKKFTVFSKNDVDSACDYYAVQIDGNNVKPEIFRDISYIHFETNKSSAVKITSKEAISNFEISPLSKQIKGKFNKNDLSFKIPGPGYYVIRINGNRYLFLLADAPRTDKVDENSPDIMNVKDFISKGENGRLITSQLQSALDKASGSRKTLFFPTGIYYTGTLEIKSNTKIYLAAGAVIKGSEDPADYPTDEGRLESDHINRPKETYTDNGEWMTFSRLILIDNAENVQITGSGVIDGSGSVVRSQGKPANLIRIRRSKDIVIDGVVLRDPAAWNTHIQMSEDVIIRNVKVINDFDVANTDGFDPDASKNVLIDNCFAYCNDDNVAIKTTNNLNLNQDLDNIIVRNCVFLTRKSALKVGTETKAENMTNILFENNDVIVSDRGIVFYCNDGATFRNIQFVNNRFEYSYIKGQQRGIHFVIRNRYGKGNIDSVLVKDNVFYQAFPKPSEIYGLDETSLIQNVIFENLVIAGKKINSFEEGNILTNEFIRNVVFK